MNEDPHGLAEARSSAYALFAYLFRFGVTAEIESAARAVDELEAALAHFTLADRSLDLDALAAEHHRVFGLEVHPAQSVFLDPAGHPGGELTEAAADRHRQIGHALDPTAEVADHLAVILDALSFLTGASADAYRDDLPTEARRVDAIARAFLADHLLTWLPPLACAVQDSRSPLAWAILEGLVQLVAHHATDDAGRVEAPRSRPADPPQIFGGLGSEPHEPAAPPGLVGELDVERSSATVSLEDPATRIRDIVRYLATPARSGLLLTLSDLARIGRSLDLPRGFGAREMVLATLFESAADHDAVPALLAALEARRAAAETSYQAWSERPGVGDWAAPWLERLKVQAELLERMASATAATD